MTEPVQTSVRVFLTSPIFAKTEIETIMENSFKNLKQIYSEYKEGARKESDSFSFATQQRYERICLAHLYVILTQIDSPFTALRELIFVSRDKLSFVISKVISFIVEFLEYFTDKTLDQTFWLVEQLVKLNASSVDRLILAILRQIPLDNNQNRSLFLSKNLLNILISNHEWLSNQTMLLNCCLYFFLRQIEGHGTERYQSLLAQEIEFCELIFTTYPHMAVNTGRDLLRCLQMIGRQPPFNQWWSNFIATSEAFKLSSEDVLKISTITTPTHILVSRIPFKIEKWITFYASNPECKTQPFYQKWFIDFFSEASNQSLVPDVIRFICSYFFEFDNVKYPRSNIIALLLSTTKMENCRANAKFALFYDWFFACCSEPSLVSIECGVELLCDSLASNPQYSASLLEFLLLASKHSIFENVLDTHSAIDYCFKLVYTGNLLNISEEGAKSVLDSLPINIENIPLESQNILKGFPNFCEFVKYFLSLQDISHQFINELQIFFPEIFKYEEDDEPPNFQENIMPLDVVQDEPDNVDADIWHHNENYEYFDDINVPSHVEISNLPEFESLPSLLREIIPNLDNSNSFELRSKGVELFLGILCSETLSDEVINNTALVLCHILSDELSTPCTDIYTDKISNINENVVHFIFRNIKKAHNVYNYKILRLLKFWKKFDSRLGYHILYSLMIENKDFVNYYSSLLSEMECIPPVSYIITDLKVMAHFDRSSYHQIILQVISSISNEIKNNISFIKFLAQSCSPLEINAIISKVISEQIILISDFNNHKTLIDEIKSAPTYSRQSFWKIYISSNPSSSVVIELLKYLNWVTDSDDLYILYSYIQKQKPTTFILKSILKFLPDIENFQDIPLDKSIQYFTITNILINWICKRGKCRALISAISMLNGATSDNLFCLKFMSSLTEIFKRANKIEIQEFLYNDSIKKFVKTISNVVLTNPAIQLRFHSLNEYLSSVK